MQAGSDWDFPFALREAHIDVLQNAIIEAKLGCDLRIEELEDGNEEKWLGVDLAFTGDGNLSGTLSAVQPPEAEGTPEAIATAKFAGVATIDITSLRIVHIGGEVWSCWFSGALQLLVPGATWPKVAFDEIGIQL